MIDDFVLEYIRAKRAFYDIPHIPIPKPESEEYKELAIVASIVDELGGTYKDFMLCQMRAYRAIRIFPKPGHLIGIKAIDRYKIYMRNHKIAKTPLYAHTDVNFKVLSTGRMYRMEIATSPVSSDSIASCVMDMAKHGKLSELNQHDLGELWEDVQYVIAKYSFINKLMPESLVRLRDEVRRRLDEKVS
jgi:hypothetical protein